jgi:hypothetical protein
MNLPLQPDFIIQYGTLEPEQTNDLQALPTRRWPGPCFEVPEAVNMF